MFTQLFSEDSYSAVFEKIVEFCKTIESNHIVKSVSHSIDKCREDMHGCRAYTYRGSCIIITE